MANGLSAGSSLNVHEVSVCMALLKQVTELARSQDAISVQVITLRIGPLSGVEPNLLRRAFGQARRGTLAERGRLRIEATPVQVHCRCCETDTTVVSGQLLRCGCCGGSETTLTSGTELLLVDLLLVKATTAMPNTATLTK
jgi:hydrogenase nickel incorporation protein HypA/HybF